MLNQAGKYMILAGIILIITGILILLAGDKSGFLFKLPGDIRIIRKGFSLYIPLTSMILLSIILSLLLYLFRKFF